jgi:hypothetical protein
MTSRASTAGIALAITAVALALTSASAGAAATRADYVAQVDPICQAAFVAEKAADKAFHRRIKKDEQRLRDGRRVSKSASASLFRFYGRLRLIGRNMDAAIVPIAPAPGDELTVQTWLAQRERSIDLQRRAMSAIRRGQFGKYFGRFLKAIAADVDAYSTVRDFGFAYCTRVWIAGPGVG